MRHFINADQPANPTVHTNAQLNGLTKREHFAAMAMQGLMAYPDGAEATRQQIAKASVAAADALLAELAK